MSKEERLFYSFGTWVSEKHDKIIRDISEKTGMPLSRVASIAIDNELERDNPFEFDKLPDSDESTIDKYAKEGGWFLNYMKKIPTGKTLDQLVILRHEMGISNKTVFLAVIRDCLDRELIEAYTAKRASSLPPLPENCYSYRIADHTSNRSEKMRDKKHRKYLQAKEYYEKYKSKFEEEA